MFGMVRFGEFLEAYDELAYTLRILGYNVNLYFCFTRFMFVTIHNNTHHNNYNNYSSNTRTETHTQHTRSDKRK